MRFIFTLFLIGATLLAATLADVSSLTSERKINLEDIERDTLLNEIRVKSEESLQAESTEHVPPSATGPGATIQHVQHVQHSSGPTASPPTAAGGAVSHQSIVYHSNGGNQPTGFTSADQSQSPIPSNPSPTPQYQSGITYAHPQPQSQYPQTAPAFHYSHSAPAATAPGAHLQQPSAAQQQIQYVQQPIPGPVLSHSHQPVVYYSHHAHYPQEAVQYVTFQPQSPHAFPHISSNLIAPPNPQVHEEGRTFAAPSRHSLEANVQQQKYFKSLPPRPPPSFRPKPLIAPQPQYIYVQANQVASAQQQRQYQQKFQQQREQVPSAPAQPQPTAANQKNVEIIPSQGTQIATQVEYIHQQQPVPVNTPFYQYSGTFGHPQVASAGVPVNNYFVVPYPGAPNVYPQPQSQPQVPVVAAPAQHPTTTLTAQPIVPEVPHYVHPTKAVIPNGPPPAVFIQPPHHTYVSPSGHPHPPSFPHHISYPSHPFQHPGSFSHGPNYFTPSLDLFGQYSRHTSLLDSYVPSNVVYAKTRQFYGPSYYGHSHGPVSGPFIPNAHQIESEHSPIYNTIAYSTEQRPVVVPPPPKTKRDSTILRPAVKTTTLTKVEKKN